MIRQYKRTALDALRGNWKTAMLTGFVASLFGATTIYSGGASSSANSSAATEENGIGHMIAGYLDSPAGETALSIGLFLIVALVILGLVSLFIGGAMRLGYAKYNLNLIDRKSAVFGDLFSQMNRKWDGFVMNFLTGLFIFLWSLLLVIPGVVKTFSYAMTPFILSENPEMRPKDAITASRELMDGHKFELFLLYLSFIGWNILASIPGLISMGFTVFLVMEEQIGTALVGLVISIVLVLLGAIPLTPYMEAANAAFYREISPKQEVAETNWYQPV